MKKVISLILCAILVLSMAVSAFAATNQGPRPLPNNPTPGNTINPLPMNPAPSDSESDVIVLTQKEEENPNTGAPVLFAAPAVIAAVAAAAVIGKRK